MRVFLSYARVARGRKTIQIVSFGRTSEEGVFDAVSFSWRFLGGAYKEFSDLGEKEAKRRGPRFYEENFRYNLDLLKRLQALAEAKKCTVAQLALAWILHQGEFFVPIPGTYKFDHLQDNAAAADIHLAAQELTLLDKIFPREGAVAGARHAYDRSKELNI